MQYRITATIVATVADVPEYEYVRNSLDEAERQQRASDVLERAIIEGFLGGRLQGDESIDVTVERIDG